MKNIKKILIIDPYLDTLGGGERHILSIGKVFLDKGYDVHVAWEDKDISPALKERFGWENPTFLTNFNSLSILERLKVLSRYEFVFYVTDGSYFISTAGKTFIFSMYPKRELYHSSPINKLKWMNTTFLCNSEFTRRYIAQWTGRSTEVLYPFIDETFFNGYVKGTTREPIILTVGRFFNHLHAKNHEFIIESFNKMIQKYPELKKVELYIVGGLQESERDYFEKLEKLTKGNGHIHLCPNLSQEKLLSLFERASFYWHGAGYGAKEEEMEKVEHFGITPVEAMASGCVVFSHNSGGQREVITSGENGFLYNSQDELIDTTANLFGSKKRMSMLSEAAYKNASQNFSYETFYKNVCRICKL